MRERKIHKDPAGNRTRNSITSLILLPLSHWTHGRGAEASLLITTMLEASADSSCLSLCCHRIHCLSDEWRSPADGVVGLSGLTVQAACLSEHSHTPASGSIISWGTQWYLEASLFLFPPTLFSPSILHSFSHSLLSLPGHHCPNGSHACSR